MNTSSSNSSSNASAPRVETDLLGLIVQKKPHLFCGGDMPVAHWKDCWAMFYHQMPIMYRNGEEWFFYHRGAKQTSCGMDADIQRQFAIFAGVGLKPCDDSKVNAMGIYAIVPHPNGMKKVGLRADLTFHRFLGETKTEEDGSTHAEGEGMCPFLWGIGAMGDGLTYIKVKFSTVRLNDSMKKIAFDAQKFVKGERGAFTRPGAV